MNTKRPKLLFIGGLHRSGTTPLVRMLGTSPNVSIFRNTGAIEDEGQFLQTVFPCDGLLGGPGRFAFNNGAHLRLRRSLLSGSIRSGSVFGILQRIF